MHIAAITIITDPDSRQDPWQEWIRQALETFDTVHIVYGRQEDGVQIAQAFGHEPRVQAAHLHWPQPEWAFEELPLHLNLAVQMAKDAGADWIVKLDCDTVIHERDSKALRRDLERMPKDTAVAVIEKYQFILVDRAYERGKIPIAIRGTMPIGYGQINGVYSDLCQPMFTDTNTIRYTMQHANGQHALRIPIPIGRAIPSRQVGKTSVHCYNYDWCFKSMEEAKDMLYYSAKAHAKFWGYGYDGRYEQDITPESAMQHFMAICRGRINRAKHVFRVQDHPKHFQELVAGIREDQLGKSAWGKIPLPA